MSKLTVEGCFNQHFINFPGTRTAKIRDLGGGRFSAALGEHEIVFTIPEGTSDTDLLRAMEHEARRLWHKVSAL
jgi:hypothetical protein